MNKYSDWLRSQAKEHGYCADEWPDTRQGKISAVIAVKSAEAADAFDALLAACQAAVADGRTIMEVKKMAGVAGYHSYTPMAAITDQLKAAIRLAEGEQP